MEVQVTGDIVQEEPNVPLLALDSLDLLHVPNKIVLLIPVCTLLMHTCSITVGC